MVLNNKSSHQTHFIALSGLQINNKMTPKIIDASSFMSPSTTNNNNNQQQTKKRGGQQLVKQFHPVKLFTNGVGSPKLSNGASSPSNGQAIRSPDIVHQQQQQPLKRHSPKSYTSSHTKIDHHVNHNPRFSPPQQQQQQRTSPSRISPTVKSGSGTPVAYAGAKFSEPPPPNELPKPPTHWMMKEFLQAVPEQRFSSSAPFHNGTKNSPLVLGNKCCNEISDHIKILLNMQA